MHRFHPPLIYGRRGGPDDGEGIALCRFKPKNPTAGETYQYLLITYLLPILSAKAVPQMVKFCETHIGNPEWKKWKIEKNEHKMEKFKKN